MSQYLLSTYAVEGDVGGAPASPDEMQAFMKRVIALEAEMDETGTFVFGGALHGPDAATVVNTSDADVLMTDGPFVQGTHRRVLHHQRRRSRRSSGLGPQSGRRYEPCNRGASFPRHRTGRRPHESAAGQLRWAAAPHLIAPPPSNAFSGKLMARRWQP